MKDEVKSTWSNANIMDYLVIICIATVILFIVVNLYFYYIKGIAPPIDLIPYFFAFFGGELIAMASITVSKNIWKNERDEVDE